MVLVRRISTGDFLLYNPASDSLHKVDPVGYDVFRLCTDDNDVESISRKIARKHEIGIANENLESEVKRFLEHLAERGIVHWING